MTAKQMRQDRQAEKDLVATHFLFSALYEAGDLWELVDLEAEARGWARTCRRNKGVWHLVYDFLIWRDLMGLTKIGMDLVEYED